jgi:hypothetical protein
MERLANNEETFVIDRIVNENKVGGGSLLPPQLSGQTRVPVVSNLRLIRSVSYFGGTQFTIGWNEPGELTHLISHFNIYVTGLLDDNKQPLGPFATRRSPAQVRAQSNSGVRPVALTVQTVLLNGQVSDMELSPSITAQTIAPALVASDYPDGSIPIEALFAGTAGNIITWDGGGTAIEATPASIDIVLGSSGLTTAGRLVVVSSAGVVKELTHVTIDNTDSPYSVPNTVLTILANTASGAIEVDLPAAASWSSRLLTIKNIGNTGNLVTIDGNASETIDGHLTVSIRYGTSVILVSDGSNWHIT